MLALVLLWRNSTAHADPLSSCSKALDACKVVVSDYGVLAKSKDSELAICSTGFNQMLTKTQDLSNTVQDRDDQLNKFYRNPFIMVLVGAVIYGVIKR